MKISWNSISVAQFQEIHAMAIAPEIDELSRLTRLICVVHNLTEQQVDELTVTQFNALANDCRFLLSAQIPGKPVKSFMVGTRKYSVNYTPSKLKHRQYVEISHFANDPIANLHYILASIVQPVKWGFKQANKASRHQQIAQDMLNAPITVLYHTCIFFCKLYKSLIEAMRASLVAEMMEVGKSRKQAEELVTIFSAVMDGSIQPNKWPNLKASA
ncbi:hypothetical protein [Mucilaginibacter pedocola]|nr:hypothetical protein [Mucilaginibacter pedocola]